MKKKKLLATELPPELAKKVKEAAKLNERSVSAEIRITLNEKYGD